ncbi:MAG: hypothetical protein Q8R18_05440 [bacterium]|nr:hypothetical protein [bacterium]
MKKGELTMETVIVLILILIVLIAVALIFRGQITNFVKEITGISSSLGLEEAAKGLKP